MYYIYHIPGKKIGCTTEYPQRCIAQGFTNYELLETHNDGWLAGDREKELQKEYGYPVDLVHYMISRRNRRVWTDEDRMKGKQALEQSGYPHLPKATLAASKKKMKITYEIAQQIRNEGYKPKKNQYADGPTLKSIAEKYNVSPQVVKDVIRNRTYTSPTWPY